MACGQKKQNNTQTGVHLTERTCSPYNPIIKQIVDDCLGLPIYPVTSIDAVIDEDGNTLRKLLEDLILQINEGDSSYEEIVNKITQIEIAIEGLTADKERLKALLWAISALTTMGNATENNIWEVTDSKPHIVHVIEHLNSEIGRLGTDFSNLNGIISGLKNLLLAVANFNTGAYTYDGLEHYEDDNKIKIIKEILDIKAMLGDGSEEGTLVSRIEALEGHVRDLLSRVDALEAASATHAHLDPKVLAQIPNESISEKNKDHYRTLKISEYPPTSAEFLRSKQDVAALKGGHTYYFGFLPPISYNKPNPYPFGHTEDYGYPLYIKDGNSQYQPLTSQGQQIKMGDNYLSGADFIQENELIMMIHSPAKLKVDADNLPEGTQYSDIYYYYNGHYYVVGDFNFDVNTQEPDNQVSIADVNRLIEDYLHGTPQISVSAPYSNSIDCGYLIYKDAELGVISYPCIKGKIYADSLTGILYRYESNRMLPVSEVVIKGDGVDVSKEIKYAISEIDEDEETVNYGPYTEYTISVDSVSVPSYIGGSGIDIEKSDSQDDGPSTYTINIASNAIPAYNGGNGIEVVQRPGQPSTEGMQYEINLCAESNDGSIKINTDNESVDFSSNLILQAKFVGEGKSVDGEYEIDDVEVGEYFITESPVYVLPTFGDTNPFDDGSDTQLVDGQVVHTFSINDVSAAIDALLRYSPINAYPGLHTKFSELSEYVDSKKIEYAEDADAMEILNAVSGKLNEVLGNTNVNSTSMEVASWTAQAYSNYHQVIKDNLLYGSVNQQDSLFDYYYVEPTALTNVLQKSAKTEQEYQALKYKFDFDEDDETNISDIASMVDLLLSDSVVRTYSMKKCVIDTRLLIKLEGETSQPVNESNLPSIKRTLVKAEHSEISVLGDWNTFYYYSDLGTWLAFDATPKIMYNSNTSSIVFKQGTKEASAPFRLNLEYQEGELQLKVNNVIVSTVTLPT